MKLSKTPEFMNDIRMIMESEEGRRALVTAGAYVAATHFGLQVPEIYEAMLSVMARFSEAYPYRDPVQMISDLWQGAQYLGAATLDFLADKARIGGIEMTATLRESVISARDFLIRGSLRDLTAAKDFVVDTAQAIGGSLGQIVSSVQDAAPKVWNAGLEAGKSYGAYVLAGIAFAKTIYEGFDTTRRTIVDVFRFGKKAAKAIGITSSEDQNFCVNAANTQSQHQSLPKGCCKESIQRDTGINMKEVLWISEALGAMLRETHLAKTEEMASAPAKEYPSAEKILQAYAKNKRISGKSPVATPEKNRTSSREAGFERRGSTSGRKTPLMSIDLRDPMAFRKGGAIYERTKPETTKDRSREASPVAELN